MSKKIKVNKRHTLVAISDVKKDLRDTYVSLKARMGDTAKRFKQKETKLAVMSSNAERHRHFKQVRKK